MENIIIRAAINDSDLKQLKQLYYTAFYPERVDEFTEVLFKHLPKLKKGYWLVAEDKSNQKIVAAIALLPWQWIMQGVCLKVAEMGIVATLPEYRGKGLMRKLNLAFEEGMKKEGFYLSTIQGIPGFYYKLGYEYAVGLENQIQVPFTLLNSLNENSDYSFRKAEVSDIPFLMEEEQRFQQKFDLAVNRSKEHWYYLLNESLQTECAGDIWIVNTKNEQYYFKILLQGFDVGLIITEMSENISSEALNACFGFIKNIAKEKEKPYVRLNMHNRSTAAEFVYSLGVNAGKSYAWQVKITEPIKLFQELKPIFEARMNKSEFKYFTGLFRLNLYHSSIDMVWTKGKLESIITGNNKEQELTFGINSRWLPMLCLGQRNWEEIQELHPDVMPEQVIINPANDKINKKVGAIMNVLFPKINGWINLQY